MLVAKEKTMRPSLLKAHAMKLALFALLSATACVTINVYFPAAAAEKAADRIIEDVWGPDAKKDTTPRAAPGPQSSATKFDAQRVLLAAADQVLNFVIPPAAAQAPDLNISTPAIRQLTASMEARHAQLKPYYDSGAIGLTQDGLIEVRDQNAIPLPERNNARKLVSDENADRANLYREIATANGHAEWEADIRKTFAQRWIDKASPGWYYNSGGWKQK
jgi:uncharacterized protein YdbL (DUF1318 family)